MADYNNCYTVKAWVSWPWTALLTKCMTTRMYSKRIPKNIITFPALKIIQKLRVFEVKAFFLAVFEHDNDLKLSLKLNRKKSFLYVIN